MNDHNRFHNFLEPRSVAIIGASPQRGNPRNTAGAQPAEARLRGRIYPGQSDACGDRGPEGLQVRPRPAGDRPTWPSSSRRPRPCPASSRSAVPRACATRSCSAPASRKPKGARRSRAQLAEAAAQPTASPCIGPNCQGIWSVRRKAMLTYSPAALNTREAAARADRHRQPERRAGGRHRQLAASQRPGVLLHGQRRQRDLLRRARRARKRGRAGRCARGGALHRRLRSTPRASSRSRSAPASAACGSWC